MIPSPEPVVANGRIGTGGAKQDVLGDRRECDAESRGKRMTSNVIRLIFQKGSHDSNVEQGLNGEDRLGGFINNLNYGSRR